MSDLHVHAFAPAWGLPSSGPFALKLMAWLSHAGIPWRGVVDNRPANGPLGKSPWIEQDGLRMGDSDRIIRHLAARHGLGDPMAQPDAAAVMRDALKTAFEERFHQILEWELFLHPEGFAGFRALLAEAAPPLLAPLIARQMQRHFARQLHARGIARLEATEIAALGKRHLDGLDTVLAEGTGWLNGAEPGVVDFAVWGQVAPLLHWPMATPVATHARRLPNVTDWSTRLQAAAFGADQARVA
ncbi:hypothetical protein HUK65_14775 [Rhodobacteraceae bacterium 2376]|uniref:Thioredoxin-like fold domain-containing protein n=1 Tax=Rhabdonatronobacter sediminivivens TaxID=2743469 RepID=A0A7Z0I1J3_9RHOB|nr:hypothetical protein [Rhabdonatronobacter sediminivivens]NYS26251.1 hypothetical protein [Rhabdonatronobacter sediminivivens]